MVAAVTGYVGELAAAILTDREVTRWPLRLPLTPSLTPSLTLRHAFAFTPLSPLSPLLPSPLALAIRAFKGGSAAAKAVIADTGWHTQGFAVNVTWQEPGERSPRHLLETWHCVVHVATLDPWGPPTPVQQQQQQLQQATLSLALRSVLHFSPLARWRKANTGGFAAGVHVAFHADPARVGPTPQDGRPAWAVRTFPPGVNNAGHRVLLTHASAQAAPLLLLPLATSMTVPTAGKPICPSKLTANKASMHFLPAEELEARLGARLEARLEARLALSPPPEHDDVPPGSASMHATSAPLPIAVAMAHRSLSLGRFDVEDPAWSAPEPGSPEPPRRYLGPRKPTRSLSLKRTSPLSGQQPSRDPALDTPAMLTEEPLAPLPASLRGLISPPARTPGWRHAPLSEGSGRRPWLRSPTAFRANLVVRRGVEAEEQKDPEKMAFPPPRPFPAHTSPANRARFCWCRNP
jgi:hypothetical protein